jgi:hypothetical protein
MIHQNITDDIHNLLNPTKGYAFRRGFLEPRQAEKYRSDCARFLQTTKRIYKTIHRYSKRDYIWSPDRKIVPGEFTYRIYQSLQDKHSSDTEAIFDQMLSLRNAIEETWLTDDRYRASREGLYDYVQVTTYAKHSEGIEKHNDYKGNAPYPLLQCLVFLSQPDLDYRGGDLILYPKEGAPINIQRGLDIKKGDALLFDKSLYHQVEPSEPSELSDVGRWTAVIGGRYPKPPSVSQRIKSCFWLMDSQVKRVLRAPYRALRSVEKKNPL